MNKLTKRVLTGVLALGLLTPMATQAINSNPQITVQAQSRWHRGMPKALVPRNKKYQLNKVHHGIRVFMSKRGISLLYPGGNGSGATVGIHPRWRKIGYHTYHIRANGERFIIKKHGSNRFLVWDFGHYIGYCYRKLYKY